MNDDYIREVRLKIANKPRLVPIFGSTHDIPDRLYEYHPRLFLCFNAVENKFEVHHLDQEVSYCATLPYKSLDARALRWIWNNDVRVHGREIMRRIEASEEAHKRKKDKEFKNWVHDVADETKAMFAQDAWKYAT